MARARAAVRLSARHCPFRTHSFQQEARQNRSSKSIVIVLKQQQQHPPHNIHTWSSLFSSIDGAEPLNNDLQRLSEFLLHDINQANFSTRLHNNKSLAFICLDSNSKGMVLQPTITQQQQQQQQQCSSPYCLAFATV